MYRHGAEKDEENMEWLLKELGYDVDKHRDLSGTVRINSQNHRVELVYFLLQMPFS